jgi:hypothetical protein
LSFIGRYQLHGSYTLGGQDSHRSNYTSSNSEPEKEKQDAEKLLISRFKQNKDNQYTSN